MSARFDLSAADLKGLNQLKLTIFDSSGEAEMPELADVSLHYDTPEQVQGLAERHGLPVKVDDAYLVEGIGTFHTATISTTYDRIKIFAVASRLLSHERAQAVAS